MRRTSFRWLLLAAAFTLFAVTAIGVAADTSPAGAEDDPDMISSADFEPPAAIFLVRHAEKKKGDDPQLSRKGRKRAQHLAHLLGAAKPDAIYSTHLRRTRETAAPLAETTGVEVVALTADEHLVPEMARRLMSDHTGEVVVVVGHSNTTPAIANAMGVDAPEIPEDDYDNVYLITFTGEGPRFVALHFGDESP